MTLIHCSALILCFVTHIFYSLSPKIKMGFLFCRIIVLPPCINAHNYSTIIKKQSSCMLIMMNFNTWNSFLLLSYS